MSTYVNSQHVPKNFIGVSGHPKLSGEFWDTIIGRCRIDNLPAKLSMYDLMERARRALDNSLPLSPDARNNGELARLIIINDGFVGAIRFIGDEKRDSKFPDSSYFVG